MQILFILILPVVLVGLFFAPRTPVIAVLAGIIAYLCIEIQRVKQRLTRLEHSLKQPEKEPAQTRQQWQEPEPPPENDDQVDLAYLTEHDSLQGEPIPAETVSIPDQPHLPQAPPSFEEYLRSTLLARIIGIFTQGNPVLKIGTVIMFFGVAFLLKYAAQRNIIPIEFRLIGVTLGAIALITLGWFLRRNHTLYGLGLEGGGIGILYLTVFAAAKLYHLLPATLALMVMIGLVACSCALAVLQDARGLAVSGSIGGFLAPVLMTTGAGSHVQLFTYYALLNSGILGIAWFKSWRELNLIGFLFTFSIGAVWGFTAYAPAFFATTEPFLILFFLMYALIAVLYAHRRPLNLRGFIDGPLVFGLPIVTGGLQACLVRDFRYGLALSALVFGFFYIGLARFLWNRLSIEMRLLVESFLALGVVFASLAIPFGLDPQWTTAAWALEGAAIVWVGTRQQRRLARAFGILLQIGTAATFLVHSSYPASVPLFGNRVFLSCALVALAGLFSAFWLERRRDDSPWWEHGLASLLLAWGLAWWYLGGYRDIIHLLNWTLQPQIFLIYAGVATLLSALLIRRLQWRRATRGLLLLLPFMILSFFTMALRPGSGSLLTSWGWIAWPLAFFLHLGVLALFEDDLPTPAVSLWHMLGFWLSLLFVTVEAILRVSQIAGLHHTWTTTCWGLVPVVLLFALARLGHRLDWPVDRFQAAYGGLGTDAPLCLLVLWFIGSLATDALPAPLPYVPFFNPLEISELLVLLLVIFRSIAPSASLINSKGYRIIGGLLFFAMLNVVIGRSIHFFSRVPYSPDTLFASPIFQAAIAALWALLALTLTVWAARTGTRAIWLTGAVLLAMVVLKLFLIDLSGTGTIGRIVSFLVVGLLMLIIGFFAPLPPKKKESSS